MALLSDFYLSNSKPEDIAIKYQDKKITYNKMHENIIKYAAYYQKIGIQHGDTIALSSINSPEFIYAYFGATKIGATVVPLNFMLTLEEISYIISDSKSNILVIHKKIFEKIGVTEEIIKCKLSLKNVIVIDSIFTDSIIENDNISMPVLSENEVSTLLYTSGTTGKPKGVMLTHHNLLSNTKSFIKVLDVKNDEIFLCVLPMFHTFGFTVTILAPFYLGASIVIHETFHPKETIRSLIEDKITILCAVPSMYVILSQLLKAENISLPQLKLAVSGGAPLPVEVLQSFRNQYKIPMLEGYGLTEASPALCFTPMNGKPKVGSIGLPIPDVEIKIVDGNGDELKTGEIGEILAKGPNIMKGYLGKPEATAETVVDGWLHTGDLAYKDEDGYIFIVDRKKDLIITRGLNVYPREIEELLYQYPGVLETAVIGVKEETRGEVVKAIIVLKEHATVTKKEIMDYLKLHLASYKLPKIVEFVQSLPKNATGKILKKELS